eukprot:scaffold3184_cov33-Phaeocystis_antarctica.AAC.2
MPGAAPRSGSLGPASLGQSASWAALASHFGLVYEIGQHQHAPRLDRCPVGAVVRAVYGGRGATAAAAARPPALGLGLDLAEVGRAGLAARRETLHVQLDLDAPLASGSGSGSGPGLGSGSGLWFGPPWWSRSASTRSASTPSTR